MEKSNIPNIKAVVSNGICTGCGVCIGICNKGAISTIVKDGLFLPEVNIGTN